jgi:hypothetical protein
MTDQNGHRPDPLPAEPSGAPPSFTPLTRFEREVIFESATAVIVDIRAGVARRLQEGEPRPSVQGDIGPIVHRAIGPLLGRLGLVDLDRVREAAGTAIWALCFAVLHADVTAERDPMPQPAPDPDRA